MKNDFTNLSKRIINFCNDRDWSQFNNPKDNAISLILEASEFLEHFQWKNSKEITVHLKNNKEKLIKEKLIYDIQDRIMNDDIDNIITKEDKSFIENIFNEIKEYFTDYNLELLEKRNVNKALKNNV